jgi:hypothetical protein
MAKKASSKGRRKPKDLAVGARTSRGVTGGSLKKPLVKLPPPPTPASPPGVPIPYPNVT